MRKTKYFYHAINSILFGLLANQAVGQSTFSDNIIGYADLNLVTGSNLVSNPFLMSDNSISNLFREAPVGSHVVMFEPETQAYGDRHERLSDGTWSHGSPPMGLGDAAFLWVPSPQRISLTGGPWRSECLSFAPGLTFSSVLPRVSCVFCIDECNFSPPDQTSVQYWNATSQQFDDPITYFAPPIDAWLDSSFNAVPFPEIPPGSGAWLSFAERYEGQAGELLSEDEVVRLLPLEKTGDSFSLQFHSHGNWHYRLHRSTGLSPSSWRVIQEGIIPPEGGLITLTDNEAPPEQASYLLDYLRLFNPVREGSTFSFQFHSEDSVTYIVCRTATLDVPTWEPIQTFTPPNGGGLTTFTDFDATNSSGYYSLESQ